MENRVELAEIANEYGYDAQSRQLIEEMAELTQAINKFWRKQLLCGQRDFIEIPLNTPEESNIIEEVADVEICLDQLKYFFGIEEDVSKKRKEKIDRQIMRVSANQLARVMKGEV